jgi:hypothetical protein
MELLRKCLRLGSSPPAGDGGACSADKGGYHAMIQALKAGLGEAIVLMNAADVYVSGGLYILQRHWLACRFRG